MGRSRRAVNWVEAKHPRDDRGRFAKKGSPKWFAKALASAVHRGNASFGDFSMGAAPGHEPKGRLPGGLIDVKALSKAAPRTRAPEVSKPGVNASATAAKALGTGGKKAPGDLKVGDTFTRHGATFEVTGEPKSARRAGKMVTLVKARRQDGKEGSLTLDSDVTMAGDSTRLDKLRDVRQPGGMTTLKSDEQLIAEGQQRRAEISRAVTEAATERDARAAMHGLSKAQLQRLATEQGISFSDGNTPDELKRRIVARTVPAAQNRAREEHVKASNAAYNQRQIDRLNKELETAQGAASRAEAARKDKGGRIQSAQEERANRKVADIRDQIRMHEIARDGGPSIAEQRIARIQAAEAERAKLKAERDARLAAKLPEVKQVEPERSSGPGFDTTGLDERQIAMLSQYEPGPQLDQIAARLRAGNAPHPFRQQESKSIDERLAGLPEKARRIALASGEPDRYSGVTASSVLKGHANFGSGHDFFTVYTNEFGDEKSQLGLMTDKNTGGTAYSFGAVHNEGTWVRVRPQGRHSDEEWAYVWVDAQKTRLPDTTKKIVTAPKPETNDLAEAMKPPVDPRKPESGWNLDTSKTFPVAKTSGGNTKITPQEKADVRAARAADAKRRRAMELNDSTDPKDNGAKLKAIQDGTLDSAKLYRTKIAGPSGQTSKTPVAVVRHTPDNPSGEFEIRAADGSGHRLGWASATVHDGEQTYSFHSEGPNGEQRLEGWSDSLATGADVLANGEFRATRGGSNFGASVSQGGFKAYAGKNKSIEELDREAAQRELRSIRERLANPNLGPSMRASLEREAASIEQEIGDRRAERQKQITGEVLQAKATATASPQPEVYDKLLGPDSPIQNKSMRGLLEQMEAHGWTLTRGNQGGRTGHADIAAPDSKLGITYWSAPDGRELVVQFINSKKPHIMTERKYNAPDVTFKKAMAHVVTPTPPELEKAPSVGGALENLGLPPLPTRNGMTMVTDPQMKPLEDAQKAMMPKGAYGGQGKTLAEAVAGLRRAAAVKRESADTGDRLYGFGGVDPNSARKRELADQFERVAAEMERMDVAHRASVAERERLDAQPLDIRPPLRTPVKAPRAGGRTPGGVTGPTRSNAQATDVNDVPSGRLPGGVKPLDTSRATRDSGNMTNTTPNVTPEDITGRRFFTTKNGQVVQVTKILSPTNVAVRYPNGRSGRVDPATLERIPAPGETEPTAVKAAPGALTLGVTESSRGRTTTITLPDGKTAQRTSKTKAYTHAVVATTDNRAYASRRRAAADQLDTDAQAIQAWLDRGANPAELNLKATSFNGHGKFYSGTLPGTSVQIHEPVNPQNDVMPLTREYRSTPDYRAAMRQAGSKAIKQARADAQRARTQAAALDAGPAYSYNVERWSQSQDNAFKGIAEFQRYESDQYRATNYQVITVGGQAVHKPVKAAGPTAEERAAAKATKAADERAAAQARSDRWVAETLASLRAGDESAVRFTTEPSLRKLARQLGAKVPRGADRAALRQIVIEASRGKA
jgi:hypothetical protein